MIEIIVGKNEAGQRLDRVLEKIFVNANTGFIFKMLRKKNITLNDKKADGKERLVIDSSIKLWFSDESFKKLSGKIIYDSKKDKSEKNKKDIDTFKSYIVYEDENTIILNKPSGVLSQKSSFKDVSINDLLLEYLDFDEGKLNTFKPSICNRLDRNTSGLMVCGKTLEGLRVNNELIKTKAVSKFYLALVSGRVKTAGSISGWLYKDENSNQVTIKDKDFDDADFIQTEYEVLEYFEDCTLLLVKLITGKTHQIRAHLSSIDHPIIGDFKYGDTKINEKFKRKYGIKSQLLHSYRLVYPNNNSSETDTFKALRGKCFEAEYNNDFRRVIGDGYLENKRS
ncbi:RluA family pseudouridine synthase [Lachnoanaerobaculum umeaense]|uniref:RNA pseudouridylate synthase n=1 Tax=Lachnoanaerobaculum umeaense TaxID=617123 RepID=A0A385Q0D9_9FIRM|nr:RluA family pseudouridine synthase [Lachnoanaerobaculum umeaense]AYA99219.1 RluA family pseudouridine synthase [Lachnoanaerobaculum umeaense]PZW93345.1 RluA family pseudouridine synthase [Lachnoanaerobaculum umeaense]